MLVVITFGITQRACKINLAHTATHGKPDSMSGNKSPSCQSLRPKLLAVAGIGLLNGNLKRIANMTIIITAIIVFTIGVLSEV